MIKHARNTGALTMGPYLYWILCIFPPEMFFSCMTCLKKFDLRALTSLTNLPIAYFRVPTRSHFPRKSHYFKSPWNGPIIVPFLPKSFLGPIIVPFFTMGSSREFSYPLFLDDPVLFFVTLYYLLLRDLTRCYRHLQILLKAAL